MDHTSMMNLILANACPSHKGEDGVEEFYIETHCTAWIVKAEWLGMDDNGEHSYRVVSFTTKAV